MAARPKSHGGRSSRGRKSRRFGNAGRDASSRDLATKSTSYNGHRIETVGRSFFNRRKGYGRFSMYGYVVHGPSGRLDSSLPGAVHGFIFETRAEALAAARARLAGRGAT